MQKKHIYYDSYDKETLIHGVIWLPEDKKPIGVVQIIHGMLEFVERYDEFANYLVHRGYIVCGNDHVGHGNSILDTDHYGIINAKNPDMVYLIDVHNMRKRINESYPDLPFFMFGHSMGSYILRRYLTRFSEGVAGAIICGTGTENTIFSTAGLAIIELMSLVKGSSYRSTFVRDLTYTAPYKKYDLTGNDYENNWLSKDLDVLEKYYNDDRCTFIFALSSYKALVRNVIIDNDINKIRKIRKDLPVLFVSGSEDPVGNLGKGTKKAYRKFKFAGIKDVTLKLFEGDRHEILHETDRFYVHLYIDEWLKEHNPA